MIIIVKDPTRSCDVRLIRYDSLQAPSAQMHPAPATAGVHLYPLALVRTLSHQKEFHRFVTDASSYIDLLWWAAIGDLATK